MRRTMPMTLLLLVLAAPAWAQRWPGPPWQQVPYVGGTWFLNGDERDPCSIVQRGLSSRALFINEQGSEAWGMVQGDRVFIPTWTDGMGSRGLWGQFRGDRIIWPNGSFWSR
jgi:hypothetical protein